MYVQFLSHFNLSFDTYLNIFLAWPVTRCWSSFQKNFTISSTMITWYNSTLWFQFLFVNKHDLTNLIWTNQITKQELFYFSGKTWSFFLQVGFLHYLNSFLNDKNHFVFKISLNWLKFFRNTWPSWWEISPFWIYDHISSIFELKEEFLWLISHFFTSIFWFDKKYQ